MTMKWNKNPTVALSLEKKIKFKIDQFGAMCPIFDFSVSKWIKVTVAIKLTVTLDL